MVNNVLTRIVQLLRKPPEERQSAEVDVIIPWLRKKCPIMQDIKNGKKNKLSVFCLFKIYGGLFLAKYFL